MSNDNQFTYIPLEEEEKPLPPEPPKDRELNYTSPNMFILLKICAIVFPLTLLAILCLIIYFKTKGL